MANDLIKKVPSRADAVASDGLHLDLSICDREPITRLDRIQPFGFLLATSRTWIVKRASENLGVMLGVEATRAIGMTLDDLVDTESLHEIRNRMAGLLMAGGVERIYGIKLVNSRPHFDVAIHYAGNLCILEGEPAGRDSRMDAASLVRKMVARLNTLPSLDAFHRDAARQVRSLTGFDRVMIYRFSPQGDGEVIAEVTKSGVDSYLGLHYPASDIPAQARALYLRNSFRIIPDVSSGTIALLDSEENSVQPLDLSLAVTRAVSPVHIEYLRNMGVSASMSISVIVEGKLWGLIACHHGESRLPSFVTRTAAELFGQMYSMTLEGRLRLEADNQDRDGRDAVAKMLKAIAINNLLVQDADWLHAAIQGLIECDGLAVVIAGQVSSCGASPRAEAVEGLVTFLNETSPQQVFVTNRIGTLQPGAYQDIEVAAGAMCIPVSQSRGDYLMLFRREQIREIRWAGQPGKAAIRHEDASMRLSPRKSFAAFAESVRGQARPFSEAEQRLGDSIRTGFIDVLARSPPDGSIEQARLSGRQELLIAELNHRVRNVLALIRGLISQSRGDSGDSAKYVDSLNGRVQALARAHDRVTQQNWGPGRLIAIFDDEISAYVPTRRDRFVIGGADVLLHPQAYSTIALIIHELVTNSCKYGALSDSGRVDVRLTLLPGKGLLFKWLEQGGPTVKPPTRRGFGSVIIERVVPFDLQGTAKVSYLEAGLEAEFFVPDSHIAGNFVEAARPQSATSVIAKGMPAAGIAPLLGQTVLLLEDNLIVAMEAEDMLRTLGAISVVAVSSVSGATRLLEAGHFDFAVLDINLGFDNSLSFAQRLRSANVPFVFASGYGEQGVSGESRIAELVVSKPYDMESLTTVIALTLARHAQASDT